MAEPVLSEEEEEEVFWEAMAGEAKGGCGRAVDAQTSQSDLLESYKVEVIVMDDTNSASMIVFGKEAERMLDIPVEVLIQTVQNRGEELVEYPMELEGLIDRRMLFKIAIKGDNVANEDHKTYNVQKVCTDDAIIASFFKHYEMDAKHDNGSSSLSVNYDNDGCIFSSKDSGTCSNFNDGVVDGDITTNAIVDDDVNAITPMKRSNDYVCTIEFQKRGLPHAHILLWLHNDDKPKNPEEIDRIICAEIPDEENDRKMYQLVEKYMIHGPCGQANLKSPCMKDRVCTKRFPKPFVQRTESDADGFTVYRKREDGRTVTKKKTTLDNGFVVPYNRILLSKYRAHINIELCNQNKSIKYLFKYVNKGHERVTTAFYETRNTDGGAEIRDEIKMYYDCRYLSACEAMWRLFNFDIHYRDPSVIKLSFHLPDHQPIVFNENQSLQSVLDRPSAKQTMFLAWFEANKNYPHARDLRYGDFPQQFVYKEDSRTWVPRKKGFSIGRIANVPPGKGEDYYLRLLLNIQKGCTCYEDIRKVFDIVYPTFRDACYVLGLLDDDKEYIDAYIRRLFAVMLLSNSLSRPEHVWQSCWLDLADGIAYKQQRLHKNPDLHISDESLKNYTLTEIEKILQSNDELDYDRFEMGRELQQCLASITDEQRKVYDVFMDAVTNNSGGMFFLYGHGGTGKTFLWKTLPAAVRSNGEIVINVASSGIASLLLPGGRTAHYPFGLPINVHESSTCSISQQSPQAELLIRTKLIIWDEAPMMHRYCFEALDKTRKSILQADKPFGGNVVVLGGDFRQILPVVLKASRQNIVHATINSSPLWNFCRVMKLTKNMKLQSCSSPSNVDEIKEFGDWILNVGNEDVGEDNDGEASIEIPDDMLIGDS
ncbi:PREDICTED: uncharacterized protein LOC105949891 [Erythranthe guttata]|uniref:uncharacterized protein LOC105949891 n=1 Tax=Erythranthe guttata TaxID=4155 RepID=UPI00064DC138|nr:PREDICTED: uncharacterized protein LOC105949891 [Erythranthe guttata]|eukprot:XP_012828649.1 PREDICTED: uncharacterized protein LOC105949891 [Erythranthe guttata]